jgi:hypothetical protein
MTAKICTNSNCRAQAHLVYTMATRCIFCRCDLQPADRTTQGVFPMRKSDRSSAINQASARRA